MNALPKVQSSVPTPALGSPQPTPPLRDESDSDSNSLNKEANESESISEKEDINNGNLRISKRGRIIKTKTPIDYEDL